ncbi:MAG: hypothetical protein ACU84J_12185 [Gammaproteobacteria bacterium]
MKKPLMLSLVAASFTFGSLNVYATSDSRYPASDFQPKVIFIDESAVAKPAAGKSEFDPKFPASSFTPKVVFVDPDLVSSVKKPARKVEFDPKYPAANFEPKVIYP